MFEPSQITTAIRHWSQLSMTTETDVDLEVFCDVCRSAARLWLLERYVVMKRRRSLLEILHPWYSSWCVHYVYPANDWFDYLLTLFSSSDILWSETDLKLKLCIQIRCGGRLMCRDYSQAFARGRYGSSLFSSNDRSDAKMRKCANARLQKLKLLWTQVLPVAEAVLRIPVTKELCLLYFACC